MAYHRQQGVDTAIVRIFNTYGPRMRPHDGRAIPTFVRQAMERKPITVFGDGSQTRSFCYVDDLIRGLIALVESGEHMPVNIGNPEEFTLLELAEKVIEIWGTASEIVYEALPTDDPKVRRARHHARPAAARLGARGRSRRGPPAAPRGARRRRSSLSRRSRSLWRPLSSRPPRLCVPAAGASRFLQVGLFDDAQFNYGNPDKVFPVLRQLRTQLDPGQPRLGRPERRRQAPAAQPDEPERPRLRLVGLRPHGELRAAERDQGRVLDHRHAAVGERRRRRRTSRRVARSTSSVSRRRRLAATAAPSPGADGRILPAVRSWLAWSEPNNPAFLRPQYRKVGGKFVIQSAIDYAKICNAVAKGIRKTTVGASKVACGVTGPRGNNNPNSSRPAVSPLRVPAGDEEGRRHRASTRTRTTPITARRARRRPRRRRPGSTATPTPRSRSGTSTSWSRK